MFAKVTSDEYTGVGDYLAIFLGFTVPQQIQIVGLPSSTKDGKALLIVPEGSAHHKSLNIASMYTVIREEAHEGK